MINRMINGLLPKLICCGRDGGVSDQGMNDPGDANFNDNFSGSDWGAGGSSGNSFYERYPNSMAAKFAAKKAAKKAAEISRRAALDAINARDKAETEAANVALSSYKDKISKANYGLMKTIFNSVVETLSSITHPLSGIKSGIKSTVTIKEALAKNKTVRENAIAQLAKERGISTKQAAGYIDGITSSAPSKNGVDEMNIDELVNTPITHLTGGNGGGSGSGSGSGGGNGNSSGGGSGGRDIWENFKNTFFNNPENAQTLVQDHADHMNQYGQTYIDSLTNANTKQNALLDSLTNQSKTGTGMYKPFQFKMLGQNVSFVPRPNMKQAQQLAGFGQQGYQNNINTAGKIKDTASMTDPSTGKLAYLDALKGVANMEELRHQFDTTSQNNINANNMRYKLEKRKLKQNEPGWSDYLGSGVSILNSLKGLWGD